MAILLTGATGFIGSEILRQLVARGTEVIAPVRSAQSAAAVTAAGGIARIHDLTDVTWLADELRHVEGAIHTAAPGDASSADFDDAVLAAVTAAFAGTAKHYVHTGGIWSFGAGEALTEDSPYAPPALTAWRQEREESLLAGPVDASLVVPGIVHGKGGGIPNLIVDSPRDADGAALAIGTGEQHWPTVHVTDLADLYLRVLDAEQAGVFLGVSGENPTVSELVRAAVGDGVEIRAEGEQASAERLGDLFAGALFLDQQASGAKARTDLGWTPTGPGLLKELAGGYR